ncbi:hypothetical protein HOLleu_37114 [Holothuria leucospilota]|uniref:Uncharacterized protein n=1 Tax=Holothuria leucospilota TaxID=206669 RepID=A0A9Q0YHL1_HOLLE|nr:hypothetical protein HOLleu_37114 [Holothuria leucospilota]
MCKPIKKFRPLRALFNFTIQIQRTLTVRNSDHEVLSDIMQNMPAIAWDNEAPTFALLIIPSK